MNKSNIDNIIDNIYDLNNNAENYQSLEIDNKSDNESIIDTSWLNNYNRLYNLSEIPEKEIMEYIGLYFIYINKNSYIEKILYEKQNLEKSDEYSFLKKESILKIIQSKKITTPTSKYKLIDILSFIIDVNHEEFDNINNTSLKIIPIFNDIHISKSIFIFHNINNVYFIFQEKEIQNQYCTTLKSILKDTTFKKKDKIEDLNLTKKVKIITHPREQFKFNNRFTKKNKNG
jgi:hypothetical protein